MSNYINNKKNTTNIVFELLYIYITQSQKVNFIKFSPAQRADGLMLQSRTASYFFQTCITHTNVIA